MPRTRLPRSSCLSSAICAVGAASILALATPAAGQDVAVAEALFNRGLAEMMAGRYETGCPALAESQRIDPQAGTLFTLAECEAKRGRIATAATLYRDYLTLFARLTRAEQARQQGRDTFSIQHKAAIEPEVPELTLSLPANAPAGTLVQRDGVAVREVTLGVGLPIDPGEHVVTAQAPGGPVSEVRVTLAKREKKALVLQVLTAPEATKDPPLAPQPALPRAPSGRRVAAYTVGSLGLAGLVLGGVMGGLTLVKKSVIDASCGHDSAHPNQCAPGGTAAADSARTTALVSTIGFGVGLAGVATAVVLWLTEPTPAKRTGAWNERGVRVGVLSVGATGAVVGGGGAW